MRPTTVFSKVLQQSLSKQTSSQGVTIGNVTTGQLSFPKIGQDNVASSVSVPLSSKGLTFTEYIDIDYVRFKNSEIDMSFSDLNSPFDVASAEHITRKAYTRLEAVGIPSA